MERLQLPPNNRFGGQNRQADVVDLVKEPERQEFLARSTTSGGRQIHCLIIGQVPVSSAKAGFQSTGHEQASFPTNGAISLHSGAVALAGAAGTGSDPFWMVVLAR